MAIKRLTTDKERTLIKENKKNKNLLKKLIQILINKGIILEEEIK